MDVDYVNVKIFWMANHPPTADSEKVPTIVVASSGIDPPAAMNVALRYFEFGFVSRLGDVLGKTELVFVEIQPCNKSWHRWIYTIPGDIRRDIVPVNNFVQCWNKKLFAVE